jgi:hypothetical protein
MAFLFEDFRGFFKFCYNSHNELTFFFKLWLKDILYTFIGYNNDLHFKQFFNIRSLQKIYVG